VGGFVAFGSTGGAVGESVGFDFTGGAVGESVGFDFTGGAVGGFVAFGSTGGAVGESVGIDSTGDSMGGSVGVDSTGDSMGGSVGVDSTGDSMGGSVGVDSTGDSMRGSVGVDSTAPISVDPRDASPSGGSPGPFGVSSCFRFDSSEVIPDLSRSDEPFFVFALEDGACFEPPSSGVSISFFFKARDSESNVSCSCDIAIVKTLGCSSGKTGHIYPNTSII
jgi:hypothetical protein